MPQDVDPKDQARFVFQGTVQQLNAVTMRSIAATANTITVKVDRVVRGPDVCNDFVGREITIYTNGGPAFARTQCAVRLAKYSPSVVVGCRVNRFTPITSPPRRP